MANVTLYANPLVPTQQEAEHDLKLELKARAGDLDAAYELGAREALLSFTTNLDYHPEAAAKYEEGRANYAPKEN